MSFKLTQYPDDHFSSFQCNLMKSTSDPLEQVLQVRIYHDNHSNTNRSQYDIVIPCTRSLQVRLQVLFQSHTFVKTMVYRDKEHYILKGKRNASFEIFKRRVYIDNIIFLNIGNLYPLIPAIKFLNKIM